jgi:RHS repeat-associated protein
MRAKFSLFRSEIRHSRGKLPLRSGGAVKSFLKLLFGISVAVFLMLPVSASAIDLWEAHTGDPCCGIPPENYKYMDANEACVNEVVPVTDSCNINPRNIRNNAGAQAPGACFHDLTCICDVCSVGPPPYHYSTFSGKQTTKLLQTCPDAYLGRCDPDTAKSKGPCVDCTLAWSNPTNVGSFNKYQREVVYRAASGGLELVLTYNSQPGATYFQSGPFGRGWSSAYFVRVRNSGQSVIAVERPEGREFQYSAPASGMLWSADPDVNDRLLRVLNAEGTATLRWDLTSADGDRVEEHDGPWANLRGHVGTLLRIRDRALKQQTMSYSTSSTPASIAPRPNLLIAVSDHFGRQLSLTYDAQNRVVTMTDPGGGVYAFQYDGPSGPAGANNLTKITFPDGKFRVYFYNEPAHINGGAACSSPSPALANALTGLQDENGVRFATWTYGCDGRSSGSEYAGGVNRYTFSSVGGQSVVIDPLGTSRTIGLQRILGVAYSTGIQQPAASGSGTVTNAFVRDANGNLSSHTDYKGNRTNYTYDLARNLETSRTEALTASGAATPQTRTISTQWHPTFRLPTGIAEPLRSTTFAYDPDGTQCGARGALCSRTIQPTSDANGSQGFSAAPSGAARTWTYTYNANGDVLSVNGPRTDAADVTSYTYYADDDTDPGKRGNVATITNALGHTISITAYNAHGQPLTMTDANGLTTTMTYDARQRLETRTVGGETTSYDYDFVGQLTKVTLPDGSFLSYTYDNAHRLTGMQDNLGNRIAYTLDAMGNRTQEQVFDPANQLAQTRSRVFNNLNRLFRELGAQSQTTEYAYDDQGNAIQVKDPLNRVTSNQYDELNRLRQVTAPLVGDPPGSPVTQYAYNGLDALIQVTDPRNLVTRYTVDGLGNLMLQESPDTGKTICVDRLDCYDAAGNLTLSIEAKGQHTTYVYDALNRVTLITFHDGSKQTYAYDQGANGIGRLSSITETNPSNQVTSVIAYAYDQHGRVTSETRTVAGIQYVLAYRYDISGRLDQLTYPSGRLVNYSFDGLGRVSGVTTTKPGEPAQTVVSGVAYHPFGGVKGYTLGNGQVYARGIDPDGRIDSYTLGGQVFDIRYDLASRIWQIEQRDADPPNTNNYDYDNLDRLTFAGLPATQYNYAYDAVGNRTSRTAGSSTDNYAYSGTSNRIASITPPSGPVRSFVFDPNGSTTADGVNTYAYDARGRMVQATSTIGTTSYQVNALGQRIRKTNILGDTVFHYDTQGRLIAETGAAGALMREYAYLGEIPVLVSRPGSSAGAEVVLDNVSPAFAASGTWPASTAAAGFIGANYQTHEANGAWPGALVVDNSDAGFSVRGTWAASSAVSGYLGTNYRVHAPNGEPPASVVADNAAGSALGDWPASTAVGGYHGTNYQVHAAGTGTNSFTWTLNVPAAGTYEVRARWTAHPNRATNAKFTVNHAGGAQVVSVNMENGGGQWNTLGTYSFNAGATTISLSDEADGYLIADAVLLVPPGAPPNTATWTLNVPASGEYRVYARWTQHPNRATNAPYTVQHAAGTTTVLVNQEAGGGQWFLLGSFGFNAGPASVSLTDQANDYVIADAVMLAAPEAAPSTATWTPNVAQAGQYELYARWTAHSNRATNATYAVTHASGTMPVAVNQQLNGGAWNLLGTFTLDPGTAHKIALTDQANGFVVADALRLVPVSVPLGSLYYFAHVDHLNTPRLVANQQGETVWRWDQQEPFGVNVPDENPLGLGAFEFPLRFSGQYADKETNLHYNYFRDYDPVTGRYVQSDPIGLSGGINTYAYVASSPLMYFDKDGLEFKDFLKGQAIKKLLDDLLTTPGVKRGYDCANNLDCEYWKRFGYVAVYDQCKDLYQLEPQGKWARQCEDTCSDLMRKKCYPKTSCPLPENTSG